MSFNLLYALFVISIQACFSLDTSEITSQYLFDISIFLIFFDTFINCNTSFYKKGYLCIDKLLILKQYYHSSEFISDILSLFSLLLLKIISEEHSIHKFLYFPIVLKFYKIPKTLSVIEQKHILRPHIRNLFSLFNLLFNILLIAHFCACFWIFTAKISSEHYSLKSWINTRGLWHSGWEYQYLEAFYFCIVTMSTVGYGDIVASNYMEKIVCIVMMFFACGVFGFSINTI